MSLIRVRFEVTRLCQDHRFAEAARLLSSCLGAGDWTPSSNRELFCAFEKYMHYKIRAEEGEGVIIEDDIPSAMSMLAQCISTMSDEAKNEWLVMLSDVMVEPQHVLTVLASCGRSSLSTVTFVKLMQCCIDKHHPFLLIEAHLKRCFPSADARFQLFQELTANRLSVMGATITQEQRAYQFFEEFFIDPTFRPQVKQCVGRMIADRQTSLSPWLTAPHWSRAELEFLLEQVKEPYLHLYYVVGAARKLGVPVQHSYVHQVINSVGQEQPFRFFETLHVDLIEAADDFRDAASLCRLLAFGLTQPVRLDCNLIERLLCIVLARNVQDLQFAVVPLSGGAATGDTLLHLWARITRDKAEKQGAYSHVGVQLMRDLGINANARNHRGETPLHVARSQLAVFELIHFGADADALDKQWCTAHRCCPVGMLTDFWPLARRRRAVYTLLCCARRPESGPLSRLPRELTLKIASECFSDDCRRDPPSWGTKRAAKPLTFARGKTCLRKLDEDPRMIEKEMEKKLRQMIYGSDSEDIL